MAVTGLMLFGFVIVHLLGNLQIYLGSDRLNTYAALLQGNKVILWSFRLGMLALVTTHVTMAMLLALENRAARPVRYLSGKVPYAPLASRTMVISGLVLFGFILFHLLHLTVGVVHPDIMHMTDPKGRHDVYQMMILGFGYPWVSASYIVAMVLLFFHLSHGVDSFFQTLGLKNGTYGGLILGFSQGAAALIFLGNCSIPVAILTKLIH